MFCDYSCRSPEHVLARRRFLGELAVGAGAAGIGFLTRPAASAQLAKDQKRVICIYMAGGLSQLESWDPKPKTDTGGPFRSIPTSVPGVHLSELLPMTAKILHHLALIRSINTNENDHGLGQYLMLHGRRQTPASEYPEFGAVAARALAEQDSGLPGHVKIYAGGGGSRSADSAYLGPKYSSVVLGGGPPQNSTRPAGLSESADEQRQTLRRAVNDRFALRRRTAQTDAYTQNYEQALDLMKRRDVFDVTKEPAAELERYGKDDIGRHCLLARRLVERGVTYVQVTHSNYDTHNENFNFHLEQLGEFDRAFATLVTDLVDRGLWKSTLLVVMSEFGRTPAINPYLGRDHWGTAWSVCLGGGRVHPGAVIGKTNANGTAVVDRQVDHGHLFHTYLSALGLDSTGTFDVGGHEMPMADPAYKPIDELLA
jgi:hypothetical protein